MVVLCCAFGVVLDDYMQFDHPRGYYLFFVGGVNEVLCGNIV